jgi:hypothetical protein
MSTTIDVARVQQYKSNVLHLYQQNGSVLKGAVREEKVTGKQAFFDRLGATAAIKRTTRHGDTPLVDSQHSRRMVTLSDYEWADLIDDQDKIRMLIDPTSAYAMNAAKALGRAFDDVVIAAFDGTAYSGEDGTTSVAFTDEDAGDEDFSGAAVDIEDILTLKYRLDAQDVPQEGRHMVVDPALFRQLLRDQKATSADYQSVKALIKGEFADTFLGFRWHMTTRLTVPSANKRYCFAWHEDSMGVAMGQDIVTEIGPRADKSYATQVYVKGTFGATRIQGNGVVRFKIADNV